MLPAICVLLFFRASALSGVASPDEVTAISTGKYTVGVYYFPGWLSDKGPQDPLRWLSNWVDIKGLPDSRSPHINWPEREPLLGYYPEEEQWVADWHIKWMAEHGISFIVYDWYWNTSNHTSPGEHALLNFLKSPFRKNLRFTLLWDMPPQPLTVQDCAEMADYWSKHYFNRPEFFKIDGKPVVFIFSAVSKLPSDLDWAVGKAANPPPHSVRDALEAMRDAAAKAGHIGIYFVAVGEPPNLPDIIRGGFDATTGYNYPLAGAMTPSVKVEPYETMIQGGPSHYSSYEDNDGNRIYITPSYKEIWEGFRQSGKIAYFVPTIAGWDPRPWYGDKSIVRVGSTPEKFKTLLEAARDFVDRNPVLTKRIILVEAWNEFGEGSYVEPTVLWRFGYLDAIREVFANSRQRHQDVVPDGLPRYSY
jgi:hypothetical protein